MILEYYLPKGVAVSLFYPAYDGEWSSQYVTSPAGLDSEASLDKAAFADCTNEWTEIGASGVGYLDLTAGEMDNGNIVVQTKSSTAGVNFPLIVIRTYTEINANVVNWKGSAAPAMTGDAYARLGAPVGASISADITTVDTVADNTYAIVNSGTYGNSALKTLIDALNNLSGSDVQTAVDAILTAAQSALATMPSETSSLEDKINWLFARLTHKEVVDTLAGTTSIYKSDGTTVLGVADISDDGNAFTRAKVEAPA